MNCKTIFLRIFKLFTFFSWLIVLCPLIALTIYFQEITTDRIIAGGSFFLLCKNTLEKVLPKLCTEWLKNMVKYVQSIFTSNHNPNDSKDTDFKTPGKKTSTGKFLYILVVGKSGSGKTSTVMSFVQKECTEYHGHSSLKYARNSNSFGRSVYALICKCLRSLTFKKEDIAVAFKKGFHAIIYCFTYKDRLTNEDTIIIKALEASFGSCIIKNNMILAMTFGEDFRKTKEEKGYDDFEDFLGDMEPCILKNLLEECSNRCVLFENESKLKDIKNNQANALFTMIDDMLNENSLIKIDRDKMLLQDENEVDISFSTELDLLLKPQSKENQGNKAKDGFLENVGERSRKEGVLQNNNNSRTTNPSSGIEDNGPSARSSKLLTNDLKCGLSPIKSEIEVEGT